MASTQVAERARLRVPSLDGFRGYAALAVVLIHTFYYSARPPLDQGLVRSLIVSGYMGVDFFFVISGFVLFLPVVTNGGRFGSLRSYGLRRVARILPAYYLMVIGIVVLHPLIVGPADLPHTSARGAISLLLHLTFLEHAVGPLLGLPLGFAANPVVWTLTIEALFYLLLPLVAGWYFRRPFIGLAISLAVASLWKLLATSEVFLFVVGGKIYDLRVPMVAQLPTYAAHFAAGMTAAWLLVKFRGGGKRLVSWTAVPAQALALVFIIFTMRTAGIRDLARGGHPYTDGSGQWHFESWTHTTRVGVAFAVLLLATALAPRWAQWPASNSLVRRLGDISYGIYLWHFPIMGFALTTLHVAPSGTDRAFFHLLAITLGGSLVAGWMSFTLLERPVVRWAQRRSRRPKRSPRALGSTTSDAEPVNPDRDPGCVRAADGQGDASILRG